MKSKIYLIVNKIMIELDIEDFIQITSNEFKINNYD